LKRRRNKQKYERVFKKERNLPRERNKMGETDMGGVRGESHQKWCDVQEKP
jgi:hypothetical protein